MAETRKMHSVTFTKLYAVSLVQWSFTNLQTPEIGGITIDIDDRQPRDLLLEAVVAQVRSVWT